MSFFKSEPQLPEPHPNRMMADAKHALKFLECGVGMFFDVGLEFERVEFTPVPPTCFGSQRPRLSGGQIAVNGGPAERKASGGLGFGTARLDEFHDSFPQVQCIRFHAHKPITPCTNVNMNYYMSQLGAAANR